MGSVDFGILKVLRTGDFSFNKASLPFVIKYILFLARLLIAS